jgi:glycosyltransferase involved in cell wall biosynthesis
MRDHRTMHVLHIINSLDVGGAENALVNLVGASPADIRHDVVSLTGDGPMAERLRSHGCEVTGLDFRGPWRFLRSFTRLVVLIRRTQPDVIQTWMYHSDILGALARAGARSNAGLVWGVRLSEPMAAGLKFTTRLTVRLAALMSRIFPDAIVANAEKSRPEHARLGYPAELFRIVPNGFDTTRFRPDAARRTAMRREFGLGDDAVLAGLVGRFSAQKNQIGLIAATGMAAETRTDLHLLLCGRHIGAGNGALNDAIGSAGLGERTVLLDERPDTENVYAALDFYVSASLSEGFPNVIAEAMACGLPCIATDVGNCRDLIGRNGIVVPPADRDALARAIGAMADLKADERQAIGEKARRHVEETYSLAQMAAAFANVWRGTLASRR